MLFFLISQTIALVCNPKSGFVCSTKGTIFRNDCTLKAANQITSPVLIYKLGKCICSPKIIPNPVCSIQAISYKHSCALKQAKQVQSTTLISKLGICICNPKMMSNPLCSRNGTIFRNSCELKQANQTPSRNSTYDPITNSCVLLEPQDISRLL